MKTVSTKSTIVVLILWSLSFLTLPAFGAIWYVDGDAPAGGDGQSWAGAFRNIQTAIDAATSLYPGCFGPLDGVWVKEDVYYLSSQIEVNKVVTILGGFDGTEASSSERDWVNNPTIIHGLNSVRCLNISDYCIVDGFTIRNGNPSTLSGGGIYIEGGIRYCSLLDRYYTPTIRNCTIMNNTASVAGGGIYILDSDPVISNCTFSGNAATTGGAIYHLSSSPRIWKCIFTGNVSTTPGSLGGGAIGGYSRNLTTEVLVIITNSLFYQNVSGSWGGAISYNQVYPTITNCSFSENLAIIAGGGFHGNMNSTAPRIRNSIFWGNTPDELDITSSSTYLDVSYSNIQGGWTGPGTGNINQNPLFIAGGELHLTPVISPCIDTASNYYAPPDDLAGVDRPLDGDGNGIATCDMGVWEESVPISGVDDIAITSPHFLLHNQPNPFNPSTSIKFNLPENALVSVRIFDLAGHLVKVLLKGDMLEAGEHTTPWSGQDAQGRAMPSGTYFYRLDAGKYSKTKAMMLIR